MSSTLLQPHLIFTLLENKYEKEIGSVVVEKVIIVSCSF